MIFIGYPGIGKTTLSNSVNGYIDLKSECFYHDGVRSDDWYKPYVDIAIDLDKQGYKVFVSSHKQVREELLKRRCDQIFAVYPGRDLKHNWINRLRDRYVNSENETQTKNYNALIRVINFFDDDIRDLEYSGFHCIEITDMDYVLEDLLRHPFNSMKTW